MTGCGGQTNFCAGAFPEMLMMRNGLDRPWPIVRPTGSPSLVAVGSSLALPSIMIILWIALNSYMLITGFDPNPYQLSGVWCSQ